TTDVERAHGELRAGLADGLRRDDAHGFADVDHVAAREIAPVTHGAHAAPRFAGQHRADDDALDAGIFHRRDRSLVDGRVGRKDDLTRDRVDHLFEHHATEDALAERL